MEFIRLNNQWTIVNNEVQDKKMNRQECLGKS